eukprot:7383322-Prymnesium_polylepis.3
MNCCGTSMTKPEHVSRRKSSIVSPARAPTHTHINVVSVATASSMHHGRRAWCLPVHIESKKKKELHPNRPQNDQRDSNEDHPSVLPGLALNRCVPPQEVCFGVWARFVGNAIPDCEDCAAHAWQEHKDEQKHQRQKLKESVSGMINL